MLRPNREPNLPAANVHNPSPIPISWRWLRLPLVGSLFAALALALATFAAVGPALAYSDTAVDTANGLGAQTAHPSPTSDVDDGQAPPTPNNFLDDVTIWSATMTASVFPKTPSFTGYSSHHSVGTMNSTSFAADGHSYTINVVALSPEWNALGIRVTPNLDPADTSQWMLIVDGLEFAFADADIIPGYEENETLVVWDDGGLSWGDGQQVSLRLIEWEPGTCPVGEDVSASVRDAAHFP